MITPKLSSSSLLSDSTKQLLIYGTIGVILGVGVSKLIDLSKSGRAKIRKITVADQSLFESTNMYYTPPYLYFQVRTTRK